MNPPTVPGYWLPQAVVGLRALVSGEQEADSVLLEAVKEDRKRTALFLALALPVVGAPELAVRWLRMVLGATPSSTGETVDAGVREVWRRAARGGYGDTGRVAVIDWLSWDASPEAVDQLRAMIDRRPVTSSRADNNPEAWFHFARGALVTLTELGRRFSAEAATETPSAPVDEAQAVAPTLALLDTLIGEGSADEVELIVRAEHSSRRRSENSAPARKPVRRRGGTPKPAPSKRCLRQICARHRRRTRGYA